jgi:tRNA modification GTPase
VQPLFSNREVFCVQRQTVVALSTPPAPSLFAVVRMSGPRAHAVADEVFLTNQKEAFRGKGLQRALRRGFLQRAGRLTTASRSCSARRKAIRARNGRIFLPRERVDSLGIVDACVAAGALPAGPGEFTRRAFENGKLDLSAAEAVAELIAADGLRAARAAHGARKGAGPPGGRRW